MSALADRFPTLARHWQVLRESWRDQTLADKAFRPREEHEFLPAALEVMETPPSPGLRWLLWLTCGLFVLALVWAVLGKIDVVAVAAGKTVPAGNVKLIQPIEIGAVRAIHVRNGEFVRKGQLLLELDPTLASADEAQSAQTLVSAQVLQARNDALLAYLDGRPATFVAPAGTPENIVRTERAFVRSAIAQYEAERASLRQRRAEKQAELAGAQAEIAKLRESLPYLDRQMGARAELAEKGYYSRLKLLEYEQLRAEHVRNIDIQTANAARASAAIGTLDAELRSLRENFSRTAVTELAEANDKAGLAAEEVRKSARRRQFQELRAPVDGVVQQLAVNTVGGVVQPAQPLMVIVPCTAGNAANPSRCSANIAVEASVQNKDIGFVRVGQRVAVKLEAFNFTDYGLLEGTVETISRDAIDQSQEPAGAARDANGRPVQPGLVYAARIVLACSPSHPRRSPLCDSVRPGMAAQAEIKTGRRRIIQYLLSPLSQAVSEAARER
jgi:hemolysin D